MVRPSTYRSILAMASRMSSTRSRHSLGGNHRLVENPVAELRLERSRRHQFNPAADALGKLLLQTYELEQPNRPGELDKQIDVTVLSALIPGEGTEQGQARDAKGLQQGTTVAQNREDVFTPERSRCRHPGILTRGRAGTRGSAFSNAQHAMERFVTVVRRGAIYSRKHG